MSLSRILNDEPSPDVSNHPAPSASNSTVPVIDPALLSPPAHSARRSPHHSLHESHDFQAESQPPNPRGYEYQPMTYQGTGGWNPYNGDFMPGDIFPLGRGNGDYYPHPERSETVSPHDSRSTYYKEGDADTFARKRRRGVEEDDDYCPPGLRQGRVSYSSM